MKLESQSFFLLRTPLLPACALEEFNREARRQETDVLEMLKGRFDDPLLKEALFVASPELYQEYDKWLLTGKCPDKTRGKLQQTLLKYWIRSCTRATPYGLFAGCTVGRAAGVTRIELCDGEDHHRYRRLDTNYLAATVSALLKDPLIADNTRYVSNSSLYMASDRYRYAEYAVANGARRYNLVAVDRSGFLDAVIDYASEGAYKIELVEILEKMGIERTEADAFIESLIAEQILISELEPTVTGDDFLEVLIRQLHRIAGTTTIVHELKKISNLLQRQDTSIQKYRDIQQVLETIGVDASGKDFIQTDLFLQANTCQLHKRVIDEIVEATASISQVTGMAGAPLLDDFKRQFYERYEEQEISLAIALDSELGIGYGSNKDVAATFTPLIDGLVSGYAGDAGFDVRMSAYDKWQLDAYLQTIRSGREEIVVTEKEVDQLRKPHLPFLPSAYIFGTMCARDAEAVDAGDFTFYLKNFSGSSSANLLGRFCAGNEELAGLTTQAVKNAEPDKEDCVYAEIVHLPQSRLGNILARPFLRNYEIVYLGNSYLDAGQRTDINDLYVSIRNNEIVLRSRKLNKRIIPRLTTAHNFSFNSLPVYQFLCDLQFQQSRSGYAWVWTEALNGQHWFPRVRYRHLILARAHWKISLADCGIGKADLKEEAAVVSKMSRRLSWLTEHYKMPQQVVMVEGDNELLLDFTVSANLALLQKTLLKRGWLYLYENIQPSDNCFIRREGKAFTNELIIPVSVTDHKAPGNIIREVPDSGSVQRSFTPGSDWQYFKIYCGTNTGERVLREVVHPLVAQLEQTSLIDKWFFIRYADPQYHLRLRFHHTGDPAFQQEVHERLNRLLQPFFDRGLVYRVQSDTYNRELERYGLHTMMLSEDVFHADSQFIMSLLNHCQTDDSERYRWLWTLEAIDACFDAAGLSLPNRLQLATENGARFIAEFGGALIKDQLASLYRRQQKLIEQHLNKPQWVSSQLDLYQAFNRRNDRLRDIFQKIDQVPAERGNVQSVTSLLPSYIHMFINRAFHAKQRKYELVLYYFLTGFYKSQIARGSQRV